ncbi:MAG TPA: hypothetical protein VNH15_05575 [Elusimicrobiota bacterium]|nr:hypothetical protein [Elusimicrobiota bacterium]
MEVKTKSLAAALLASWLAAPGLLLAQEQGDASSAGADSASGLSAPVQIDALAAPLSGASALAAGPASLGAAALPASALNAALTGNTAVLPAQKAAIPAFATRGPAPSAAAADMTSAAPIPTPPAEPYFAKILVKLGADPALAGRLGEAALEPSEESRAAPSQTPDLAAAAVEGSAGAGLSTREKAAVIAAALVAAHPALAAWPGALISELETQTGVAPQDVAAVVQAAGFAVPSEDAAAALPATPAWTAAWGRRVSFAAKVADGAQALLGAKSLAEQIRAENALNSLRQSPDFAIFPTAVRQSLQSLVSAARQRRLGSAATPLNEAARAQAPPASPAQARAIAEARTEAADLGLPAGPQAPAVARAAGNPLSALKKENFVVLPAREVPDFPLENRILAAIDESEAKSPGGFWQWAFLEEGGRQWRTNKKQTPELVADVRAFAEGLTRELQAALPDENIAIRDVQIRVNPPPETAVKLHVDGGYITLTCALRGPGTVIYDDAGGRVRRLETPPGAAAFVSSKDREFADGMPGAVHSAPASGAARRVIFIIRYKRAGQAEISGDARARQNERDAKRIKAAEKFAR